MIDSASSSGDRLVALGRIGAAHGVRGEAFVFSYTDDPLALGAYGVLRDSLGRSYEIVGLRRSKSRLIARFRGVEDRNAAEALKGTELFVFRSAFPEPSDSDEFYHCDLIGMEAFDEAGERIGKVLGVENHGAGDVIEIERGEGIASVSVSFTRESVPSVELSSRRMTIRLPEDS